MNVNNPCARTSERPRHALPKRRAFFREGGGGEENSVSRLAGPPVHHSPSHRNVFARLSRPSPPLCLPRIAHHPGRSARIPSRRFAASLATTWPARAEARRQSTALAPEASESTRADARLPARISARRKLERRGAVRLYFGNLGGRRSRITMRRVSSAFH